MASLRRFSTLSTRVASAITEFDSAFQSLLSAADSNGALRLLSAERRVHRMRADLLISSNHDLRAAWKCMDDDLKLADCLHRCLESPLLFQRLCQLFADPTIAPAHRLLVEEKLEECLNAGAALSSEQRSALSSLRSQGLRLAARFALESRELTSNCRMTVPKSDLAGIASKSLMSPALNVASTDSNSAILILNDVTVPFYLSHLQSSSLRQQILQQFTALSQASSSASAPLQALSEQISETNRQILQLLTQSPPLPHLSSSPHATRLRLSDGKAASKQYTESLQRRLQWLQRLENKLKPLCFDELKLLNNFSQKQSGGTAPLTLTDFRYFQCRYRQQVSRSTAFPLSHVMRALGEVLARVFQVSVKQVVSSESPHATAESGASISVLPFTYEISLMPSKTPFGRVCVDFLSHPHKQTDAATIILSSRPVHHKSTELPSVAVQFQLVDYQPADMATGAVGALPNAVLSIDEVRQVFHEFGHVLQQLLPLSPNAPTTPPTLDPVLKWLEGSCSGEYVNRSLESDEALYDDVRELPSRFMETLLCDADVCSLVLPQQSDRRAAEALAQCFRSFGAYHALGHVMSAKQDAQIALSAVQSQQQQQQLGDGALSAHLYSGAYAGTYHSYVLGSVMSADIFQVFTAAVVPPRRQSESESVRLTRKWRTWSQLGSTLVHSLVLPQYTPTGSVHARLSKLLRRAPDPLAAVTAL